MDHISKYWEKQKLLVKNFCAQNGLTFLCRENIYRGGFLLTDKLGFYYQSESGSVEIDLTDCVQNDFVRLSFEQIANKSFDAGKKDIEEKFKTMFNI